MCAAGIISMGQAGSPSSLLEQIGLFAGPFFFFLNLLCGTLNPNWIKLMKGETTELSALSEFQRVSLKVPSLEVAAGNPTRTSLGNTASFLLGLWRPGAARERMTGARPAPQGARLLIMMPWVSKQHSSLESAGRC